MNNYELYVKLRTEVGNIGTVYFRDSVGTYGRARDVYVPAHITKFCIYDAAYDFNTLRMDIVFLGSADCRSSMDNVSTVYLYLPSPINSRFHGEMVTVRTYFEMQERQEREQKYATQRYQVANRFDYDKIIFSGPCTIIIWKDGTKTMARVSKEDEFDPEKGVAICFMKRALGHTETNKTLKIADGMLDLQNYTLTSFVDDFKNACKKFTEKYSVKSVDIDDALEGE